MTPRLRLTLMLLLAFSAGGGAHYAASHLGPSVEPAPSRPPGGWPELDSGQVVELARSAIRAELGSALGDLRVDAFRRHQRSYLVFL